MEEWKTIEEFPTYSISSFGNVTGSTKQNLSKRMRDNYYRINLLNGTLQKTFLIHRLVACHFIPNPENKPYVNHKDGNKLNNNVTNLEWSTAAENNKHAYDSKLRKAFEQSVLQYSLNDELIQQHDSIQIAAEVTNTSVGNITSVCRGRTQTAGGYIWKYVNETKVVNEEPDGKIIEDYPNYKITPDKKVYNIRTKQYMTLHPDGQGKLRVTCTNKGKRKNFFISKLYSEYYENSQSQVTAET